MKHTRALAYALAVALAAAALAGGHFARAQTPPQEGEKSKGDKPAHACPLMGGKSHDAPGHGGHAAPREKTEQPAGRADHAGHLAELNARGERAMGFSQTATTHHFLLAPDGGSIEVEANDPRDTTSRDTVRTHLAQVARAFAAGDFSTPARVHDRTPPGADALRRLKSEISYRYEETGRGARVVIRTSNAEALAAVHEFLRYQIKDHGTGDSLEPRAR